MEAKYIIVNVVLTLWICLVKGDDYLLLYSDMHEKDASDPISVAYTFSSAGPNDVTIRGPGSLEENEGVQSNKVTYQGLSKNIIPGVDKETDKTVMLSSDDPMAVFGHMFTAEQGQGTLMAVHDLGSDSFDFVAASVTPKSGYTSQISVAAREPSTIRIFDKDSNEIDKQSLAARQTFTYKTSTDVTGFKITSDNPVAVTSGTTCSDLVTRDPPVCDPISAYIPPVDRLGMTHIVPQIPGMGSTDTVTIRVVSHTDDTVVRIYDRSTNSVIQKATLDEGQHDDSEVNGNEPTMVECSKSCLVLLLIKEFAATTPYPGSPSGKVSGPLMVLVPDFRTIRTSLTFHVPALQNAALYALTIVAPKATRGSLRLNGNALSVSWKDINEMPLNSSGTIKLDSNAMDYTLTSVNKDVPFAAFLFVYGPESSYGGSLISYQSKSTQDFVSPTTTEKPLTSTDANDRPSFTLAPEPSKPSTATTTQASTKEGPKVTPTAEKKTVEPPMDDYEIDYQEPPGQPQFTRRPRMSSTETSNIAQKAASWKIAVIVVVFLLAIAAVVVIGFFLIRRRRAQKDKHNSYMGQAMAQFTPDGMVDSRVTMGEAQPYVDPKQGKQTFRGRLRGMRDVIVTGLDTIRSKRRTTEA